MRRERIRFKLVLFQCDRRRHLTVVRVDTPHVWWSTRFLMLSVRVVVAVDFHEILPAILPASRREVRQDRVTLRRRQERPSSAPPRPRGDGTRGQQRHRRTRVDVHVFLVHRRITARGIHAGRSRPRVEDRHGRRKVQPPTLFDSPLQPLAAREQTARRGGPITRRGSRSPKEIAIGDRRVHRTALRARPHHAPDLPVSSRLVKRRPVHPPHPRGVVIRARSEAREVVGAPVHRDDLAGVSLQHRGGVELNASLL